MYCILQNLCLLRLRLKLLCIASILIKFFVLWVVSTPVAFTAWSSQHSPLEIPGWPSDRFVRLFMGASTSTLTVPLCKECGKWPPTSRLGQPPTNLNVKSCRAIPKHCPEARRQSALGQTQQVRFSLIPACFFGYALGWFSLVSLTVNQPSASILWTVRSQRELYATRSITSRPNEFIRLSVSWKTNRAVEDKLITADYGCLSTDIVFQIYTSYMSAATINFLETRNISVSPTF